MAKAKHPGVTVLHPVGKHPLRARWVNPETGKRQVAKLPADESERERWLLKKSAELMLRKAQTNPPPGGTLDLGLAIEKYLQDQHRLRPGTLKQYRYTLTKFLHFVKSRPLNLPLLKAWRSFLNRAEVSPASVNRDLAHTSAFLHHAREAGDIALSRDTIKDGLKRLPKDSDMKRALSVDELRDLVRRLNRAVAEAPPSRNEKSPLEARYRALILVVLLTGMRRGEAIRLRKEQVRLPVGQIVLGRETKTRRGRMIDLGICPSVPGLLKDFDGWGLTYSQIRARAEAIHPEYTFQRLRVTCGTFLTCSPGIYGGASAAMSALRLGHDIQVAQRHYVNQVIVDPTAKTLEEAMGIAGLLP